MVIIILWILGIFIIAMLIKTLLQRASITGKPLLLLMTTVVILLAALALILSGLWPVAMSLLGGLAVYGRPILRAFGLWQTVKRFRKPNANSNSNANNPSQSTVSMDKAQARKILEVEANASKEDIIMAHKRLMAKNHPDKGGSTYLASLINQARDMLLNE